ncbi:Histone-lysine N-methyltransferase setd1a [Mortierella alpina]|uniref:Histone-lysine N-methyltransferase setd1a n=1 Tax=Mortierella alpina TaxID=64518 RepID=A0A9P6M5J5_MORAP|nr:Histone-lysine N-methyltransferase setd1a [Mortierella alpina]
METQMKKEVMQRNGVAMSMHRPFSKDTISTAASYMDIGSAHGAMQGVLGNSGQRFQQHRVRSEMEMDQDSNNSQDHASDMEEQLNGSVDSAVSRGMARRRQNSSGSSSGRRQDGSIEFQQQHTGPLRTGEDTGRRVQRSGYAHSHASKRHPASLTPVLDASIPSPLASPVTATVNSLTALSISNPFTPLGGFSGRDLTKITVPRERKSTRPYSIASGEALLAQEQKHNGSRKDDTQQDQMERLSDPETSSLQGIRAARQGSHKEAKVQPTIPPTSPSTSTADSINGTKSTGSKWQPQKPAAQLRVTLYRLVSTGYLPANTLVVFREHSAVVTATGMLIPQIKEPDAATLYPWLQSEYETPSAWATAMVKGDRTGKVAVNGWSAIKVPIQQDAGLSAMFGDQGLPEVSLDVLRKRYLAEMTEDAGPAESMSGGASKAAVLDRKKRKRPSARAGEPSGLRIWTQTEPQDRKSRSETTRPRKRTMSDLSGMVTSDLFQDRQLHLEAAGALFSMQDGFASPTFETCTRRATKSTSRAKTARRQRGPIQLESLTKRQHRRALLRSQSPGRSLSALRILRPLTLIPLVVPQSHDTSLEPMDFCDGCGASGKVQDSKKVLSIHGSQRQPHQWPNAAYAMEANRGHSPGEDPMQRCFDCGECFHLDCVPPDHTLPASASAGNHNWHCPRCTVCSVCQTSTYDQAPPSVPHKVATSKNSSDSTPQEIQVLACDNCQNFTHLQCQLALEPGLKDILKLARRESLHDRDYEELGEDSRQYFCPSCIPTPIPSPTHSSSSSLLSAVNSVEQSPWQEPLGYGSQSANGHCDYSKEASSSAEEDGKGRNRKRKDDIMDLLRAAKEISDTESQANSPYSSYSPMFPSATHSRTMSVSLESVAEVAAAEALLTIFSGASTPVSSTPYTSYPPSPFEAPFSGMYDRHYAVINSPQDLHHMMGSMAFTPSSDPESTGAGTQECMCVASSQCRCVPQRRSFPPEDYFTSRPYARHAVQYNHIGEELQVASAAHTKSVQPNLTDEGLYQPLSPQLHTALNDSFPGTGLDARDCVLCHNRCSAGEGAQDSKPEGLGRLLPLRWKNETNGGSQHSAARTGWIHVNCALWSTGVDLDSATGSMSHVAEVVGQSMHAQGGTVRGAVVTDRAQRTILCSMHYREVSTLNDLRTAAMALHSSMAQNNADAAGLPLRETLTPVEGSSAGPRGPLWIRDPTFEVQRPFAAPPANLERNVGTLGCFRIGGLLLHSLGSFDMPGIVYCETGLGNDVDLERKYSVQQPTTKETARPSATAEVLAIPLGFKCERQLLRQRSTRSIVVMEVVRSHLNHMCTTSASTADDDNAVDSIAYAQDDEEMNLAWKVSITGSDLSSNREFYSTSMHDVVDTIFESSEEESALVQYGRYIKYPDSFFGLDHPFIRQQILAMDGQAQVASRTWLRYREEQRILERHCRKHSCTPSQGPLRATHLTHASEHRGTMTAARVRSRQQSRLSRKRIVRVGIAQNSSKLSQNNQCKPHSNGGEPSSMDVDQGQKSSSFQPGLSRQLVATSPSLQPPSQGQPTVSSTAHPSAGSETTEDSLQRLREEHVKDVALYWNGRRVTTPMASATSALSSRKGSSTATSAQFQDAITFAVDEAQVAQPGPSSSLDEMSVDRENTVNMDIDPNESRNLSPSSFRPLDASMGNKAATTGVVVESELTPSEAHADLRLYSTRAFATDEWVMEYVGEVISPAVAIRRQEAYQSQGRGCYMMWCEFEEAVIDATVQGGLARCIRQCDDANSSSSGSNTSQGVGSVYAKTLTVVTGSGASLRRRPKVVICAARTLHAGEELTMQYCS